MTETDIETNIAKTRLERGGTARRMLRYAGQASFIRAFEEHVLNNNPSESTVRGFRSFIGAEEMSAAYAGIELSGSDIEDDGPYPDGSLGAAAAAFREEADLSSLVSAAPKEAGGLHFLSERLRRLLPAIAVLVELQDGPKASWGMPAVHGFVEAQYPGLWPYAIDWGVETCRLAVHDGRALAVAEDAFWRGWVHGRLAPPIAGNDWNSLLRGSTAEARSALGIDLAHGRAVFDKYFQRDAPALEASTAPREFLDRDNPYHRDFRALADLGHWRSLNFIFQHKVSDDDFAGITFGTYFDEVHGRNLVAAVKADESSSRALADRYSIHFDGEFEDGTLGRAFHDFCLRYDIEPYYSRDYPLRSEQDYVWARIFNTHDIFHVLGGVDISPANEAYPFTLLRGQIPAFTTAGYIIGVGILRLINSGKYAGFDVAARGWITGTRAKRLFGIDWAVEMGRPLVNLRAEIGMAEEDIAAVMAEFSPEHDASSKLNRPLA